MKSEKEFLSLEEVAQLLSVDYQLVYKLVRSGSLPAARVGRIYRVMRNDLYRYMEGTKSSSVSGGACAGCGTAYASRLSLKHACRECGSPICMDCWSRRKIRLCADCTPPASGQKKYKTK